nr:Uncharacterised protein [Streptococcus thermophilus]
MSFSPEEVRFLASRLERIAEAAGELEVTKKSALADRQKLEPVFGEHSRAVMELVTAQRTLALKLPDGALAPSWLTDTDAAQQATPHTVAQVRAERIARAGASLVHDVTCSIGTEAPAVTAQGMDWLGTDIDFSRVLMARHNVGSRVAVADALHPVTTPASNRVIVADPARRKDGRRITDPAKLVPPLPHLLDAYPYAEMAVKCAPGIDYSQWPGLVSVVSENGTVKEACLYTPGLDPAKREAVVIQPGFTERITDGAGEDVDVDKPRRFIVEPDGAVIRAGLVRHWAAKHDLAMLDPHIAFLTGDAIPEHHSGFPFIEEVPLKKLKPALQAHDTGPLEILVRGVDVDPDQLRNKMKLKGSTPMAVVIARIGDTATAYLCSARVR